jgi:hypothetical protein
MLAVRHEIRYTIGNALCSPFLHWSSTAPHPSIPATDPSPKHTIPCTLVSSLENAERSVVIWFVAPMSRIRRVMSPTLSPSYMKSLSSLRCTSVVAGTT